MGSFGPLEWIVIGLAILLLFGAKRIPELARGLGQGIKEFRKASDDIKKEIEHGEDKKQTHPHTGQASESRAEAEYQPAEPGEPEKASEEKKKTDNREKS